MTRVTFVILCATVLAVATPAAAQFAPPRESGRTPVEGAPFGVEALSSDRVPAPSCWRRAGRRRRARRRRGGGEATFVGYVEDALVQSNVRIRFDAAGGNTVPDRAEFFYAKCGCYRGLPANHPGFRPGRTRPWPRRRKRHQVPAALSRRRSARSHRGCRCWGKCPCGGCSPSRSSAGTGASLSTIRAAWAISAPARSSRSSTRRPRPPPSKRRSTFRAATPSKGLGTDHASFEPALLMLNELSPKVTLESQVGVWLPIGGAAPVPTNADGHFAGRLLLLRDRTELYGLRDHPDARGAGRRAGGLAHPGRQPDIRQLRRRRRQHRQPEDRRTVRRGQRLVLCRLRTCPDRRRLVHRTSSGSSTGIRSEAWKRLSCHGQGLDTDGVRRVRLTRRI